jgi:hypothetical protein
MRLALVMCILLALSALAVAAVSFTASQRSGHVIDDLSAKVSDLQVRLEDAERASAQRPPTPITTPAPASAGPTTTSVSIAGAPASAPATPDDAHIKQVVDDELQAQMQRMRQQWGGGGQGGGPGGGGRNRGPNLADAATVKTELGVDDDKAAAVAKEVDAMRNAVRDIWRGGGDRDANMKAMQAKRDEMETKLAQVLSADEMKKLKDLLDQQQRRFQGGGGPGGPGGQGGPGGPGAGGPGAPGQPAAGGDQPKPGVSF